jgi:hypothetical protein
VSSLLSVKRVHLGLKLLLITAGDVEPLNSVLNILHTLALFFLENAAFFLVFLLTSAFVAV